VTDTTWPTSLGEAALPAATGMSMVMPSADPLSIVTVHSKFDTPFAMTTAGTADGSSVCRRPSRSWSSRYRRFSSSNSRSRAL
jgi:hypothetical protein